jgi:hypothetical protein
VSSSRQEETNFRLTILLVPFYLRLGEPIHSLEVSPAGPKAFHFTFPPEVPEVRVR